MFPQFFFGRKLIFFYGKCGVVFFFLHLKRRRIFFWTWTFFLLLLLLHRLFERHTSYRLTTLTYKSEEEESSASASAPAPTANTNSVIDRLSSTSSSSSSSTQLTPQQQHQRMVRDLDQWMRKMRCSGLTGTRLDSFRDVRVGVCAEPVERGAPSIEPYPSRYRDATLAFTFFFF